MKAARLPFLPRRRLLGWGIAGAAVGVVALAMLGSDIALRARARWVPGQIVPVLRRRNQLLFPLSNEARSRGVVGVVPLLPNRGHALLGPAEQKGGLVRRDVMHERGVLPDGALAWLSSYVYNGAPDQLGYSYQDVKIRSDAGEMPAWHVEPPGERDTVAIVVHGFGGFKAQGLRALPALRISGLGTLFITFRNALGAPKVGWGQQSMGVNEALDVVAALRWAREAGYKRAVLYGFCMGGSVVLCALQAQHQPLPLPVSAVVLDSPALDWRDVLQQTGKRFHLPARVAKRLGQLVERFIRWRSGQDFDAVDHLAHAGELNLPTLLFHGTRDGTIPVSQSDTLARLRPDLVEYHRVEGAKHIRSWNIDPLRYDQQLEHFLANTLMNTQAEQA